MKPGFVVFLYDKLTADGMETIVVPPTPIPVESGIEVKTDRGDSRKHAHLLERDTLKKVHVNFGRRLVFPDHAGPEKPLGPVLALPKMAPNNISIPSFYRRSVRCPLPLRLGYGGQRHPDDSAANRLYRASLERCLY